MKEATVCEVAHCSVQNVRVYGKKLSRDGNPRTDGVLASTGRNNVLEPGTPTKPKEGTSDVHRGAYVGAEHLEAFCL
jgi:hypothetical protein